MSKIDKQQQRTLQLEVRALDDDARTVPVTVSTTYPVDRGTYIEVLDHSPRAVDLSRDPLPLIEAHDNSKVNIGLVENLVLAGDRLRGVLRLGRSQRATELWEEIKAGIVRAVSVGYSILDYREESDGRTLTVTKWRPHETSLVAAPADPTALIGRSMTRGNTMTDQTTQERTTPQTGGEVRAERQRVGEIRRLFDMPRFQARQYQDMMLDAIEQGWSIEQTRNKLLEEAGRECQEPLIDVAGTRQADAGTAFTRAYAGRGARATEYGGLGDQEFHNAAVDALLIRAGIKVKEPHPAARDLVHTSLAGLAEKMLAQHNISTRGMSPTQTLSRAFSIRAGLHTTSDFGALLVDSANKALLSGQEVEPASHRQWCNFTVTDDFRPAARVRLSDAPDLAEVNEGAELTYGSFSDTGDLIQLTTYGKIISISRQALVNDNLDAFSRIPYALGQSARRKEADKVYAKLTDGTHLMADGKAIFHADHSNTISGGLTGANLSAGRAKMRLQTGPNGGLMNIVPRYLIVPVALETTAEVLLASTNRVDPAASNNTELAGWIRSLELVVDPRLDASNPAEWYLAAAWQQVDTCECIYLSSQRGVFLEEEQHFTVLGMSIRAVLDFGTTILDHRGLVKSTG